MATVRTYTCDRTGVSAPSADTDLDDFDLPEGWVEVVVRRVVPVEGADALAAAVETQRATFDQQFSDAGIDEATRDAMVTLMVAQMEAVVPPPNTVVEDVYHLSPAGADPLLRMLTD